MPRTSPSDGRGERPGLRPNRRNRWNLLLAVPFVMLVTPWFNSIEPRLFGVPFFYWSQFAWVPVGVLCMAVVHRKTRGEVTAPRAGPLSTGDPDGGR